MSCPSFQSRLRDAALGEPMTSDAEAHLRSCEACGRFLETERARAGQADRDLREALAADASPEFLPRLRARLAEESPAEGSWGRSWLVPVAVSVGAAALLLHIASRELALPVVWAPEIADVERRLPEPVGPLAVELMAPADEATPPRVVTRVSDPDSTAWPRVLIPPGEKAGFERFLAERDQWVLESGALPEWSPEAQSWKDIVIAPIEIKPLALDD